MSIIRCENIGLRYGDGPPVLRDITVEIDEGAFCFLTGPSGAGKSSLLSLLFLARRATHGLMTLFGEDVATLSRRRLAFLRRRIGVVFQEFRLLDHLTIYENVVLPLKIAGRREGSYKRDVALLLDWVGLGGRARAYPPTLSGGEKQRAAIVRAVIVHPDLIIADEPTGNVDPAMGKRLLGLFTELNRMGTTIIIATHDPALAEEGSTARHFGLDDGRLVSHG